MKTKEEIEKEYQVICMHIGELMIQKSKLQDLIIKKKLEATNLNVDYDKLLKKEKPVEKAV